MKKHMVNVFFSVNYVTYEYKNALHVEREIMLTLSVCSILTHLPLCLMHTILITIF